MVFVGLAFLVWMFSLSWRRFGPAAPATFFLFYAALNLFTMFLFDVGIYEEGTIKGSAFYIQVLPDEFAQTSLIYAVLGAAIYAATTVGTFQARKMSAAESETDRLLTNSILDRALFSPLAGIGLLAAVSIYVWHFLAINKSLLIINFRYLTISNPDDMGLSNPILALAHYATGPFGVLTAATMVYYFRRRASLYGLVCLMLTAYFVMLKMAGFSRWGALILAAVFASLMMMRAIEKRRLISLGTVLAFCLILAAYILVLEGRGNPVQGLAGVALTIKELDIDLLTSLSQILVNISIGALTTATAFVQPDNYYPTAYKILSFSPFPNAIDGFRQYFQYTAFINAATPFNGITEAFRFGVVYLMAYIAINAYCIRSLTRSYLELGPVIGLVLSTPAYFAIMAMHTYPMRNSLRLLLYATVLTAWAASRLRTRIKEVSAAATNEIAGFRTPSAGPD